MAPGISGTAGVALHLTRRFFGSLSRRPPGPADERWALEILNSGQSMIWQRMSPQDRRHAITVAKAVEAQLTDVEGESMRSGWFTDEGDFKRSALSAALLHDCGKVVSDLGTFSRVGATLFWSVASETVHERWRHASGTRRRLADYKDHPKLGADLLVEAQSSRLAHVWAAEHHRRPENWTVPVAIGGLLKDCDDD